MKQSSRVEVIEEYEYGPIKLQRLMKDHLWYAIYENRIIDVDQYHHRIEDRWKDLFKKYNGDYD